MSQLFVSGGRSTEDSLEEEVAAHASVLPGDSPGQRSLPGYSPGGRRESAPAEGHGDQRASAAAPRFPTCSRTPERVP